MADTITCPVCGEVNPADMEFCQICQSRLKPLTGPLRGENQPIQPGQVPTQREADELEPALPRWLREAREQARRAGQPDATEDDLKKELPAAAASAPDLLAGLEAQKQESQDETPEWVARVAGMPTEPSRPEPLKAKYVELGDEEEKAPLQAGEMEPERPEVARPAERDELGEWFKQAASTTKPRRETAAGLPERTQPPPLKTGSDESPSWMQGLEAQANADQTGSGWKPDMPLPASEPPPMVTTPDLPDWLKNLGTEPANAEPRSSEEQVPGWLKTTKKPGQGPAAGGEAQPQAAALPDWVSKLPSTGQEQATASEASAAPSGARTAPSEPDTGAPAFAADALSRRDVDAIFASMQTPDWLAEATRGKAAPSENIPPAAEEQPALAPAELPSWVQAMRPVETDLTAEPPPLPDVRIEDGGPLAGLHGVLPVIPGAAAATSKPQALSVKLEASEQQQAHAELLERILSSEVKPIPMRTAQIVGSQQVLRWVIAAILLIILGPSVISQSQIFPLPSAVPTESLQAVQTIEAIPAGAPVLIVFDYEPATVGEMEATAASLIDHLLLLRHPQLALISTSPTGPALAERFMSTVLAPRGYEPGTQYVDLGFLAGGLAGIHSFAENPTGAVPLGADSRPVWVSPVLQQVRALSDFASIIVLTDSAESGRTWVEQTTGLRGNSSMVVVSSAQAGPILLPYADSAQINGLVAGLYGAVGPEQANGGLPGLVRQYWDGYSMGLYLAVVLIIAGGVWNLGRAMLERRSEQAG